jgi:methylated-DNA-[protein]-cysteine S-methyltransferase
MARLLANAVTVVVSGTGPGAEALAATASALPDPTVCVMRVLRLTPYHPAILRRARWLPVLPPVRRLPCAMPGRAACPSPMPPRCASPWKAPRIALDSARRSGCIVRRGARSAGSRRFAVGSITVPQLSLHSPVGDLTVSEEDGALVALDWGWGRDQDPTPMLRRARDQLHAYFDGALTRFDLPLVPAGTAYQQRVWLAMQAIPYGATRTYGELAHVAGGSARSIGPACGANPLPILIPCHRVVAAGGRLGGFSGGDGPATKRHLLDLESHALPLAS